jgi:hypothetical protein
METNTFKHDALDLEPHFLRTIQGMYWYTVGHPIGAVQISSWGTMYHPIGSIPNCELGYYVPPQIPSCGIVFRPRACTGIFWAKIRDRDP